VQQARANFFNCCSNLVAFSTANQEMRPQVEEFQHLLVRLVSMLQCVGMQTVADMDSVRFEFINVDGIDAESLRFLSGKTEKHQRVEIVAQWIQRLIVNADRAGIIDVPPPILTRCFQELSQGIVHIINARIMTGIPFPFPYAQLLSLLLVIHWLATPAFCAVVMQSAVWSSIFTFLCVLAFWGTNYIAAEIESPFGDDPNDLPLFALQKDMNSSLWVLLHPTTQTVPTFSFDKQRHRKWHVVCAQNFERKMTKTRLWMHRKSQTKMTINSSLHGQSTCPVDSFQGSTTANGTMNSTLCGSSCPDSDMSFQNLANGVSGDAGASRGLVSLPMTASIANDDIAMLKDTLEITRKAVAGTMQESEDLTGNSFTMALSKSWNSPPMPTILPESPAEHAVPNRRPNTPERSPKPKLSTVLESSTPKGKPRTPRDVAAIV
jgi:predicted membrane chloride channel (bestrophin family)